MAGRVTRKDATGIKSTDIAMIMAGIEGDQGHRRAKGEGLTRQTTTPQANDTALMATTTAPAEATAIRDLPAFEHLLADFLFIQKQKDLYEMSDREVKGRWKSFLGKWNRGELAEGWYDPETYARTKARAEEMGLERRDVMPDESDDEQPGAHRRPDSEQERERQLDPADDDDDDDDDYGPTLPGTGAGKLSGPGIPSRQDLLLRDEQRTEDREHSLTDLRLARKADRHLQKERLEELVPRADPGSRERKLEKKQAVNDKMRSFRERSPGVGEVAEGELMGGEGDELEEYKREKKKEERKKSEREVRREEMERARREEVEERRRRWKEREEGTVESLRELARQRFGSG
ncbi:hypothetical protein LIA77_01874 [Sarocladium implicatum]|nr:hypothetical protein LIA77_01874 [Sarocladium implicatum]